MILPNIPIKRTISLLVVVLAFLVTNAQDQTMIQLKTLDNQLKPYPGLHISLNLGKAHLVDDLGVAFVEVNSTDLPPKVVTIQDPKLEVESWNFSKGILEVVIRPKTYQQITALVQDQKNQPLAGVTVVYNTDVPIIAVSNDQGIISMNIPLAHNLNRSNLFQVNGYRLLETRFKDARGNIWLEPLPGKKASRAFSTVATISGQESAVDSIDNFSSFNFEYLDSIQSLTIFYAVIKNVDVDQFDEQLKRRIDEKFYQLVGKWEDSLENIRNRRFMGNITDSSLVGSDVALLIDQALQEQQSLTQIRNQFDENVTLLEEKLATGGTNLSNEEQLQILDGINKLSQILSENERKFYQNQAQFSNLLNVLRSRLTSIDELEEKLLLSERQLEIQSKEFTQKLLTAIAIALALAIFGSISFVLTKKFQKQKNQLAKANDKVKRVNEHLESMVSERTAQLQETNQELDTFLYKSSHDLRRPLTSIVGLRNIAELTLEGEALQLFERAADTARGMDRMLGKLLNVNEINNPSKFGNVDFSSQLSQVAKEFEKTIVAKGIELKTSIQPNISFSSYPEIVAIILKNLIENALFFSSVEPSNDRPVVDINVTQQNGHVLIKLKDNGCGVDPSIKDKIWNMFYVGHEKSTGNGLGLYISRKAVLTLNGSIGLESETRGHTLFRVKLPTN
jgi:signal transduction histidine kinase